ncbi:zinc finger CCCH domain-containing protein 11 [Cucumis melo var. makuwa]|uniref:Zinc finger CCCH domain-containing protein 11 n=1 Tax=Cucumis melo var. makuwa TaxID=1194695 RepID=A0A5A7SS56_CUCMM|nr:zinc finger CCCH domain-containing protein 11 [Cucumis melo var. makuwa]
MPPKQQSKAELAKKQKVVEDKTFGLKNKNKSKNVQKYVQNLKQSVQPKVDPTKVAAKIAVSQPKVPVGVDPKSIVCEFFKVGQCTKGFKCKFSHDLNVQRKGEKIDIYSDKRDEETMEDWDQETLEKVVESKKNEYNLNKPTEIVCKYFLEAVEKKQYGWFWVCPNGGKECHYRHALPPGYRAKVKTTTPITPELFFQWKKKKMDERNAGLAAQQAERAKNDRMSGRELFLANASLFVDDAEAYEKYQREEEPEADESKTAVIFLIQPSVGAITIEEVQLSCSSGKTCWFCSMLQDLEKGTLLIQVMAGMLSYILLATRGLIGSQSGVMKVCILGYCIVAKDNSTGGPSTSTNAVDDSEDVLLDEDDDDELDLDELNELEATLSRTSIQIREPGIEAS